MTPSPIQIRPTQLTDVEVIARHRVSMFRDMGVLPEGFQAEMLAESSAWLGETMSNGTYLGWLATPGDAPDHVVGGTGVLLRPAPPTITRGAAPMVRTGMQALVINVYTEPEWRGRGVARLLMHELLADMKRRDVMNIVLHASEQGRHLYESLGFVTTNEMRFSV